MCVKVLREVVFLALVIASATAMVAQRSPKLPGNFKVNDYVWYIGGDLLPDSAIIDGDSDDSFSQGVRRGAKGRVVGLDKDDTNKLEVEFADYYGSVLYTDLSAVEPAQEEQKQQEEDPKRAFVYGTLRSGEKGKVGNHRVAKDAGVIENKIKKATISNVNLFHHAPLQKDAPFPMMTEGTGKVLGEVFEFEDWDQASESLDKLEGYQGPGKDNFYDRRLVTVTLEDGSEVRAWAYFQEAKKAKQWNMMQILPGVSGAADWVEETEHLQDPNKMLRDFVALLQQQQKE